MRSYLLTKAGNREGAAPELPCYSRQVGMTRAPQYATVLAATPLPFEPLPVFRNSELINDAEFADSKGKRIGVLIVAYNALNTLPKVLSRITPNVWANVEEIAVFDDASQDATYELALGLKSVRHLPKLTVLRHTKNLGYGGNQKAGYQYFIDKGFDIVVLLHGDGQYAPEILSHIYHPLVNESCDAVFGSRMMKDYGGPLKGGMPLYKYVGNRILSVFENRALGLRLTEFHSGYRAYNLHALKKIRMDDMTDDFHFDTEIIIKLHHQQFKISEVPIPTYYGTELCYVNGMRYAVDVARAVYRYTQTRRSVKSFPEFQEYFVHYPIKESKNSSHSCVRELVGTGHAVLDIGCGKGFFAEQLRKAGNRITGIDAVDGAESPETFESFIRADLDEGLSGVAEKLSGQRFDYILLLDILEHLRQPESLLRQCRPFLGPEGKIIISLPNVANITVRAALFFGRFEYTERGLLDKTHLRFFTRKTARKFVENAGFEVRRERATVMPVELALGLAASNPFMVAVNRVLSFFTSLLPGLLGYQIIFVVTPGKTQRA